MTRHPTAVAVRHPREARARPTRPGPGAATTAGAKLDACLTRSPATFRCHERGFPGGLYSRESLSRITVHVNSYRGTKPESTGAPPSTEHRPIQWRQPRVRGSTPTSTTGQARRIPIVRGRLKWAMFRRGGCRPEARPGDSLRDSPPGQGAFSTGRPRVRSPEHQSAGGRAVENAVPRRRKPSNGRCSVAGRSWPSGRCQRPAGNLEKGDVRKPSQRPVRPPTQGVIPPARVGRVPAFGTGQARAVGQNVFGPPSAGSKSGRSPRPSRGPVQRDRASGAAGSVSTPCSSAATALSWNWSSCSV